MDDSEPPSGRPRETAKRRREGAEAVIKALPVPLRAELREHLRWLDERIEGWIEALPVLYATRVNVNEFLTSAVCHRVLFLTIDQLTTITSLIDHLEPHGTPELDVRGEVLSRESSAVRKLRTLQGGLRSAIEENDAGYIFEAKSPRDLLRRMVGAPVGRF